MKLSAIVPRLSAASILLATPALAQTTHSVRFIAGGATFGGGNGPVPYDGVGVAAALTGGIVSSLAGANSCCYNNGNAIGAARFHSVTTMLYAHNRLYVFDSETSRIRYICRKTGPAAGSPFAQCPP